MFALSSFLRLFATLSHINPRKWAQSKLKTTAHGTAQPHSHSVVHTQTIHICPKCQTCSYRYYECRGAGIQGLISTFQGYMGPNSAAAAQLQFLAMMQHAAQLQVASVCVMLDWDLSSSACICYSCLGTPLVQAQQAQFDAPTHAAHANAQVRKNTGTSDIIIY